MTLNDSSSLILIVGALAILAFVVHGLWFSGRSLNRKLVNTSKEDQEIFQLCEECPGVVLLNKTDLPQKLTKKELDSFTKKAVISFSAMTGEGLEELEQFIKQQFIEQKIETKDELYITNVRQKEALFQARESLKRVKESIELGMPEDLYAIDLTDAYESLGKIIGETIEEDIIDKIFKDFCMGK